MKQIFILLASLCFTVKAQTFTLKSNELGGQMTNKQMANTFGCTGENKSPELHWEHAPKETQAFAVTIHDPDAPTGSGFWHWVVYNIPSSVTSLASDAGNVSGQNLPKGAMSGTNDGGAMGYMGACPPPGPSHRYIITVYALKAPIQVEKNASAALIGFMLNMNALGKASIIAYGQR